ncbi:MAG: hypothetical protein CK604_05890 [Curvibacter sp. PD_MW3]|nr:MAG: hypothetical protein CK604_05890 [Curvibacter sp. PD_MW3]
MVIYPDREPDAAKLLLSRVVNHVRASDAVRAWSEDVNFLKKALDEGRIVAIVHDGTGSRDSQEPNLDCWLFLLPLVDEYRGAQFFRVDGPSPKAFAERLAIERSAASGINGSGSPRL